MSLQVSEIAASGGSGIVTVPANNLLYAPGSILQVQTASSGPGRQTISSATPVAVSGLAVEFTPLFATSRIVIHAQISTTATYVSSFAVFKNAINTTSTAGFTNSDEANMNFTIHNGADTSDYLYNFPLLWSEIAGSTAVRTYQIYATSAWAGGVRALHINNRNSNDMSSFSHMTVTEIAQ